MDFNALLASILKAALIGGGAVAVAGFVARTWLQSQFNKQLEAFKSAQQREIEGLKYRINSYFDRAVRLHEMEFETLPELWGKLYEAFYSMRSFVAWGRMIHDLNKMKQQELELILSNSALHDFQKDEVRAATDKTKRFYEIEFWHDLKRVQEKYYDYAGYLLKKSIFLTPEIRASFDEMKEILFGAMQEKELHESYKRDMEKIDTTKRDHFEKRGAELIKELEQTVRDHLHDSKRQFLEA